MPSDEYQARYDQIIQTGLNLAQMTGAIASLAVSGDPSTGASTGLNAAKENSFKLIVTIGKVARKVAIKAAKKGKLTWDDLKDAGIDELVDFVDDIRTLTDGNLNIDDAFAILSLATGIDQDDIKFVKSLADFNKSLPKTLTKIDDFQDVVGDRKVHIFNGHLAGAGIPNKSEFPTSWDKNRIIHQVSDIASDPNAITGVGKWDSPYKIGVRDGVQIRVDFYPNKLPDGTPHPKAGKISTAYPENAPKNPRDLND